jgi:hypothetical protein
VRTIQSGTAPGARDSNAEPDQAAGLGQLQCAVTRRCGWSAALLASCSVPTAALLLPHSEAASSLSLRGTSAPSPAQAGIQVNHTREGPPAFSPQVAPVGPIAGAKEVLETAKGHIKIGKLAPVQEASPA